MFGRVQDASRIDLSSKSQIAIRNPQSSSGLWSELRFRLRRRLGILTGTIDKLLINQTQGGLDVEIVDFKTNKFTSSAKSRERLEAGPARVSAVTTSAPTISQTGQVAFDFEAAANVMAATALPVSDESLETQIENVARDYRLQMQAYALALRELLPRDAKINSLRATLHFIHPNVEFALPPALLEYKTCARAIDDAMTQIVALDGTLRPNDFPPLTNQHCRICHFIDFCAAGSEWLRAASGR